MHPSINLAIGKEAHLFDDAEIQRNGLSVDKFARFFPVTCENRQNLDATPSYMYLDGCLKALAQNNPSAKVIAIIRDPGHRAISQHYHSKRHGLEAKSLLSALLTEKNRLKQCQDDVLGSNSSSRHHSYVDRGRYSSQIAQIQQLFRNSLFIPFPLISTEPKKVLEKVQQFLGIEVLDLPILPPLNYYGPRSTHPLIRKIIGISLKNDTEKTLDLLGWDRAMLRESKSRWLD
jgi:hypothetical protein